MSIKVVGIDIAKNLFQVCVLGTNGQILSNRKIKRDKLLDTVPQTIRAICSCNGVMCNFSSLGQNISRARIYSGSYSSSVLGGKRTMLMMPEPFAKPILELIFTSFLLSLLNSKTSK